MSQSDTGTPSPVRADFAELFAALLAPFEPDSVKQRTQAGRTLHYITARTAMNRLDEVLGPENWWDEYVPMEHSVLCKLAVRLPDGSILVKSDAGGMAGMADPGDDDKSGFSDAFKRAAVKFGVGRYLYRDGIPRFAREILRGERPRKAATPSQEPPPAPESARESSPPAETPREATQAAERDPRDFLRPGNAADWLVAFVRAANAKFLAKNGHLPPTFILFDRAALVHYLLDRLIAERKIEEPSDGWNTAMKLAALARGFDADPAWVHEQAKEFALARGKLAKNVKRGPAEPAAK